MSTPETPTVNFFSLFRRGQHYAKTWPMEKRLAPMFIENRTIRADARVMLEFGFKPSLFCFCHLDFLVSFRNGENPYGSPVFSSWSPLGVVPVSLSVTSGA